MPLRQMYNMEEVLQASKRKQEGPNFGAVTDVSDSEVFNSKKQRLSQDDYAINCYQVNNPGNNIVNGFAQLNSHSQAGNNGHIEPDSLATHSQATNGEMLCDESRFSDPMECSEEQSSHKVENNGNLQASNSRYCQHGHLDMCTKYNVPCRYPRMYCHPGGMLDDRLGIYHGF